MSGPTFALDLAQIPTPVAYEEDNLSKQAEQAEQTPDGCDCDCECLRRSLSHETQIIDPPCAEEDLHGHDRGIFEDAWQAVAGWLARAGSQGADDLYELAEKAVVDKKLTSEDAADPTPTAASA